MNRYKDIPVFQTSTGKRYYGTTKYPEIPLDFNDIYVYSTVGDRFDKLALQYYSDSTLWWAISIANPTLTQGSYYIPEGSQIRIPTNISRIIARYNALNRI
jgi:phage tail protein X